MFDALHPGADDYFNYASLLVDTCLQLWSLPRQSHRALNHHNQRMRFVSEFGLSDGAYNPEVRGRDTRVGSEPGGDLWIFCVRFCEYTCFAVDQIGLKCCAGAGCIFSPFYVL